MQLPSHYLEFELRGQLSVLHQNHRKVTQALDQHTFRGELSREEDHPQRRGDPQDGRETGAETTISDYAPMLYESSAYGKVLPGVRDLDSDIRMQESSAYGVDMKTQPTCSIPM